MNDRDTYFGDFERAGEDVVRRNLALKLYQPQKSALAKEWLTRLSQSRKDASSAEQIRIARSAKNAAWAAAIAAIIAAIAAIISVSISIGWKPWGAS